MDRPETVRCTRCAQPIHRVSPPWNLPTKDTEPAFYSEWANPFGFPWCPDTGAQVAHTPDRID